MTSTQSKVPQLRFTEFKFDYAYVAYRFEDIFLFSSGKNIKQAEASPEYEIPCVRYGELYHLYDEVITKTINKTNLDESELTFSEGNEILLPSAGEDPLDIGSASALTLKDVAIGRTINVLRPKGEIAYSHIYMSYYINKKLRRQISTLARGASISNVYNSDLKTLKSNLPEIQEQNKVASFATTVDKKISLLKQKNEQLVQYKKGIMQQLFSQKLCFKNDDGQDFPDWTSAQLKSILVLQNNPVDMQDDKEYELITAKRRNGGIVSRGKYLGKEVLVKSQFELKENQFVISKRQIVHGACGLVPKYLEGAILSNEYNVFEGEPDILDIHYFNLFSKTPEMKKAYFRNSDGVHIEKLLFRTKDWLKTRIQLPTLDEQKRIVSFSIELEKKIGLIQQQIEQTQAYKQGLLQQMFV